VGISAAGVDRELLLLEGGGEGESTTHRAAARAPHHVDAGCSGVRLGQVDDAVTTDGERFNTPAPRLRIPRWRTWRRATGIAVPF